MVVSAYTILKDSPVGKVRWHRLVLDESQSVKSASSTTTKLVEKIQAARRWCLSGTPMPNQIEDLHGQLAALQMYPYSGSGFATRLAPLHNGTWCTGNSSRASGSEQPLIKLLASWHARPQLTPRRHGFSCKLRLSWHRTATAAFDTALLWLVRHALLSVACKRAVPSQQLSHARSHASYFAPHVL